ncbi:MAG: hypothetical protein AAF901_09465, partial [Bacteroidota bacterium]
GNNDTPILGIISQNGFKYSFQPVVPFSPGHTYLVYNNAELVDTFTIKMNEDIVLPELIAIYPTSDTVPENLLKMYFEFSKPMQKVGNALEYITVVDDTSGEEVDVFLELSTELWNKEHTRLTLWLDPGRIKTDLIPNKKLGLPILNGHSYRLTISPEWKDHEGNPLVTSYEKQFSVTDRDSKQPEVNTWTIEATPDQLKIHFHESMDAILAKETFSIHRRNGKTISGEFKLTQNEQGLHFYPEQPFLPGEYRFKVASKLEDLAGNNLNHLFDQDLKKEDDRDTSEFKTRSFTID